MLSLQILKEHVFCGYILQVNPFDMNQNEKMGTFSL